MTIDIYALIQDILTQSEALALSLIHDYQNQALIALKTYLENSKADLERWTAELAQGELSVDEFNDLVNGDITTALLAALEESGLAAVALDKFTSGVINIVVAVALDYTKYIVP